MKTTPPSRTRLHIARILTLFVVGSTCLSVWIGWKSRGLLGSLVRESVRRFTHQDVVSEADVPAGEQVALVPGTSIHGALLRQRVEAAARLYHRGAIFLSHSQRRWS